MGQFVTGVTLVAIEAEDQVKAMTANAFTSLSLDPPLVLFCVNKTSKTGRLVQSVKGFSINILRHDQQALATYFAGVWKEPARPVFRFIEWEGGPRLEECVAAVGCALHSIVDGGDHWIVIGRVLAMHVDPAARHPLVFFRGHYARLADPLGATAPDLPAGTDPIVAEFW
jgi:3-hydroxy-9,10-secoandrosta-1,3,5(10)-triene-9,17-dione monooxygenase reductase component